MTTAKDIFMDFLNFVFGLIIVGLSVLYFIAGDNFEIFKRAVESLVPFGFLLIIFLVNLKLWRQKAKKKEREGNLDVVLHLSYFDKLKSDFFVFSLPAAVLLISLVANKKIGSQDIIIAAAVFIIAFFWNKWLFSKERA